MTRDAVRPLDAGHNTYHMHHDPDPDLLAGLWETAPFARLPPDAPQELKDLVENIENPKRVYAIHCASRRHGFQQLVEMFSIQLRDGCGTNHCSTPTCFSFRKRSVGHVPIRRYNVTSGRVLAVYMASQDNPENALCSALRASKIPPAAIDSLLFYRKPNLQSADEKIQASGKAHRKGNIDRLSAKGQSVRVKANIHKRSSVTEPSVDRERSSSPPVYDEPSVSKSPRFDVTERHTGKDYRSFAANMFGTVAFKMLEWLTPNALEDMHATACDLQKDSAYGDKPSPQRQKKTTRRASSAKLVKKVEGGASSTPEQPASSARPKSMAENHDALEDAMSGSHQTLTDHRPTNVRRNSNARVRTNSATQPKRQLSLDAYPMNSMAGDTVNGLRSPRVPGIQAEKTAMSIKSTASSLTRPISQVPSMKSADGSDNETSPEPTEDRTKLASEGNLDSLKPQEMVSLETAMRGTPSEMSTAEVSADNTDADTEITYDSFLPQAISRLNLDVLDFICDVLHDDGTCEQNLLEPADVPKSLAGSSRRGIRMKRKSKSSGHAHSKSLKMEWKLFIEQSLFHILSDPHALIRAFTVKGKLIDSQTLWYCMLRMTRVAPTLVYHSLWLSASHLFAPPKSLQSLRSPTARLFPKQGLSLSNTEAGSLVSICFHALIAAMPVVNEKSSITEMSRLRSQGLSLAAKGGQSAELCLQYDDAFSHDLALRLARRLSAAITARRYFDSMLDQETVFGDDNLAEPDVLSPIFSQLDALSESNEESLHETRMSTCLLDWARTVMYQEWDGNPEVPGDGPFGGALALIDAIYQKCQVLRIAHKQFRCDYFAERLDQVEMPVAWLSFTSTKHKVHLLDYPFIFNSDTLISYFRAINFSRMSHAYEEAASLKSRMDRLFEMQTLIVNPHHKNVLQDLLRTAASRYLILDIGRKTVLRDAFDQLWRREERELLRPLKLHLGEDSGEEGYDSGGVQQEFFRLAMAEALDADFGAFTVDDRNRMAWFQSGSLEPTWKFELLGLLIGLAVYNGLTLPVNFPKALYRKLLGSPVTDIHHIEDGWPQIASSLTALLEWDESNGAVEDIFSITYEFSINMFSEHVSREMHSLTPGTQPNSEAWPQFPSHIRLSAGNPADAPLVTNANRNAYVSDYIRYMTDVSVRPQYNALAKGFRAVLHSKSLTLLSPDLLQQLIEGVQEIDMSELRRATRYMGCTASSKIVKDFWSVVKRYDERMKRKLLEFVTASDRVPVGGLKNITFVIQKNGEVAEKNGRLPTAYTCYGTLLLPEYADKDLLRERLGTALENAQGFGFA